jgi:hypothetical protein
MLKEGGGNKQDEYTAFKKEAVVVKKQIADGEGKLQVSDPRRSVTSLIDVNRP